MLIGYTRYEIEEIVLRKNYKNEEDRQQIVKFCLGSSHLSYKILYSKFPINKKEYLKLKWKALRDSNICALMIINNDKDKILNDEEIELAWEVALESYEACRNLIEKYPIEILDEKRRLDIINIAILSDEHIYNILMKLNNADRFYVLNLIKEQLDITNDLINGVKSFFSWCKDMTQEVHELTFEILMPRDYLIKQLAYSHKLNQDELKLVYRKYKNYLIDYMKDEYKDSRDISDIKNYFKIFKDHYTEKEEKYLISKLKTKRNFNEINNIISGNYVRQETIEKLQSLLLLKKLSEQ